MPLERYLSNVNLAGIELKLSALLRFRFRGETIKTIKANMLRKTVQMQYDRGESAYLCSALPQCTAIRRYCFAFVRVLTSFSLRLLFHRLLDIVAFQKTLDVYFSAVESSLQHFIFIFEATKRCILITDGTTFTYIGRHVEFNVKKELESRVIIFQMVLPKLQLMPLIKLEIVTSKLHHAQLRQTVRSLLSLFRTSLS